MKLEKVYNKLVRDNIPEIIIEDNQVPVTKVLDKEEYKKALEEKILEEYNEVLETIGEDRLKELADLLEIIKSLAELENSSLDEVLKIAKEKREKRGGFSKKIYLEKIIYDEKN